MNEKQSEKHQVPLVNEQWPGVLGPALVQQIRLRRSGPGRGHATNCSAEHSINETCLLNLPENS